MFCLAVVINLVFECIYRFWLFLIFIVTHVHCITFKEENFLFIVLFKFLCIVSRGHFYQSDGIGVTCINAFLYTTYLSFNIFK